MLFIIKGNKGKETNKKKSERVTYYAAVPVKKDTFNYEIGSHGIVTALHEVPISAEVQGKMLPGSVPFRPGVSFKKGQVICKIDNEEYLYSLAARKSSFINLIATILPDIQLDFPEEKNKWEDYLSNIVLNKPLPQMPMWNSKKEKVFLASRNIITEYFTIKGMEEKASKYIITAPFDGIFVRTNTQVYATISPGVQLATIMQNDAFELKAPFQVDDLDSLNKGTKAKITNEKGKVIGYGKVDRIADLINANTQSVDVYFTIETFKDEKIRSGQYVNVSISTLKVPNVFEIPRKALVKDSVSRVYVYNKVDSVLTPKQVKVERTLKDSYLISGIQENLMLITDRVEEYSDTLKVGIVVQ